MPAPTSEPPFDGYTLFERDDPFENLIGPFYWRQLEDGSYNFAVRVEQHHCNNQGTLHGGLMVTMADFMLGMTAKEELSQQLVTVSLTSEFIAAGQLGDIVEARGEIIHRTRSLAFVRGQLFEGDRPLLNASAVFKLFRPR